MATRIQDASVLDQPVRLAVPASRGHVRVARLTAAVVAERLDFDIDEIDDVLVAVDELTNALIHAQPTSEILFRFAREGDAFVAEGTAAVNAAPHLSTLARQVLGVVVDDFDLFTADHHAGFRITKRSAN
jgi:hypothetical protein